MMWSERSASAVLHSVEVLDHGGVGLVDRGEFAAPFDLAGQPVHLGDEVAVGVGAAWVRYSLRCEARRVVLKLACVRTSARDSSQCWKKESPR